MSSAYQNNRDLLMSGGTQNFGGGVFSSNLGASQKSSKDLRNPDEFYHKMHSAKMIDGEHKVILKTNQNKERK